MNLRDALKLYVIPDSRVGAPRSIEEQAVLAIDGGATMIQLRNKEMSGRELYETACRLSSLCRRRGAAFVVNDRFDIALAAGAHGVHLGKEDLPVGVVRKIVPTGFLIGATAHSIEEGREAEKQGADYVGIGAVFPTGTKNVVSVIGVDAVRAIREALSLPSVAIGGINEENAAEVLSAGVDGIAVVAAVVGRQDIAGAARRLAEIVFRGKP
ncbi:thiamine phosphate synthase [Aminivibrio sp.]|jgi:thiamine-phosphate pyrophosphorylase|uniref:thiamine phosphate synthase n=1 Tax=Aminivibrio sp. TaxID=1872489 RepID=UPI001A47C6AC|nr:thiamine phosphate synthase [Aminivibrio sp.]MBL3539385.1 thiamine phosphate synthase [Aminivibrio sp.]MDK2959067.1 thiamine-phosphate pyrophosphorylase [Synergistaceae bacterium]